MTYRRPLLRSQVHLAGSRVRVERGPHAGERGTVVRGFPYGWRAVRLDDALDNEPPARLHVTNLVLTEDQAAGQGA